MTALKLIKSELGDKSGLEHLECDFSGRGFEYSINIYISLNYALPLIISIGQADILDLLFSFEYYFRQFLGGF